VKNDGLDWIDILGFDIPPWDRPGRVDLPRELVDPFLRLNSAQAAQINRGCVGLCNANLGPDPKTGRYARMPENYTGTKCFKTEPKAKAACKKCRESNSRPSVWAKQGRWKNRKEPAENQVDGTIPNDSVEANGGPGLFNYITCFGKKTATGEQVVAYAWMDRGKIFGRTQTYTFSEVPCSCVDYPDTMWCCSCVPCENAPSGGNR
jgi:hypothetical protein